MTENHCLVDGFMSMAGSDGDRPMATVKICDCDYGWYRTFIITFISHHHLQCLPLVLKLGPLIIIIQVNLPLHLFLFHVTIKQK